jgi:DNA-binding transcriptional MerR regulator/ubiquinone/menaquinone biosynthesis C-methylase UbiE
MIRRSKIEQIMKYTIRQLANLFSISRSTLLYYEKIGLLKPARIQNNGYRIYGELEKSKLEKISLYKRAGVSLENISLLLDSESSQIKKVLNQRLDEIDKQYVALKEQQKLIVELLQENKHQLRHHQPEVLLHILLKAGLDTNMLQKWHQKLEQNSPVAHQNFLQWLGFSEKECLEIRHVTHSITENEAMMKYFMEMFCQNHRQGPGSKESTLRALDKTNLPKKPLVLDVGCGNGIQTMDLATNLSANIVAVDNHDELLDLAKTNFRNLKSNSHVTAKNCSMTALPYDNETFDLIWSEGAIYIMGFEEGLSEWKRFLKPNGYLVVSDMGWFSDNPPEEILEYWNTYNPGTKSIHEFKSAIKRTGYELIDYFQLPQKAWLENFYIPLQKIINDMTKKYHDNSEALEVLKSQSEEIAMYKKYGKYYGYFFFVLKKSC